MHLPAGVCVMSETTFLSATTAGFGAPSGSGQERSPMRAVQIFVRVVALHGGDRQRTVTLELSSLLTVKTLTGMTTVTVLRTFSSHKVLQANRKRAKFNQNLQQLSSHSPACAFNESTT